MDAEAEATPAVCSDAARVHPILAMLGLILTVGLQSPAWAQESRALTVGDFHRVHFSGAGTVHLTQGPVTTLSAHGAPEALAALEVETRDGGLYIDTRGPVADLVLHLQVAQLEELVSEGGGRFTGYGLHLDSLRLEGNGAGSFHLRGLEADELEVQGRGATRFFLSGQVGRQRVHLSGTGAYQAGELISNRISVSVAGASDVRLWADERLDVEVAGTADIRYAGSPEVEQRVSGVASVLRIPQIVI